MKSFSQRESVLLGYNPQKTFTNNHPNSSPDSPDIDFNDVFGGPPRRASIQETRCSFGENDTDSYALTTTSRHRHRWSGLTEKPVFGDESANRRRYPSQDFFDDIFKGNESLSSCPRKIDRDSFSSNPGSRVLSPVRPLPPRATETFASSSLPAQFSLPAKPIKGTDLPTFGSSSRNHHKIKDGNSSFYAESPLSRFSVQANQVQKESRSDVHIQGSLSRELSVSSLESSILTEPDEIKKGSSLKKDSDTSESRNSNQFHFSIYKWAGKGVPLALPLRKSKEWLKFERSSSASGRIGCKGVAKELPTMNSLHNIRPSFSCDVLSDAKSSEIELYKKENGSFPFAFTSTTSAKLEQKRFIEETVLPESDQIISHDIIQNRTGSHVFQDPKEKTENHSVAGKGKSGIVESKTAVVLDETPKTQFKTLRSLMSGTDEVAIKNELKERKVKSTKKSAAIFSVSEKEKKQDGETTVPRNSQDGLTRNQARGKVKEFVKIFNQEASNNPTFNLDSQSRSSRRKERSKLKAEDDPSVTKAEVAEKVHLSNGNKNHKPDVSIKVQFEKQNLATETNNQKATDVSSLFKNLSASIAASIPDGSEAIVGDRDYSFQRNILVKELSQDEGKVPQAGDNQNDFQVIDDTIRKWSNGKEGNIRSLLSTLQYVLWPESGWKPVPLVDIIEGSAVKRSYQKALLSLHPDKLQQKGATSHQKYIAAKVFDILQEAWTHFSSLGSA